MSISHEDLRTILTRPIAFHRLFAAVAGSVGGGVFLSQLYYWSERSDDPDGWVYKTSEDWYDETMLSRRELDTVRKALRDKGVIREKLAGVPATVHYKVAWEALFSELKTAAEEHRERLEKRPTNQFGGKRQTDRQTSLAENAKLDRPIPPNQSGQKRQTIDQRIRTETTAEKTTKTSARGQAKAIANRETASSSSFSSLAVVEKEIENQISVEAVFNEPESHDQEIDQLAQEFAISPAQALNVRRYAKQSGINYVREKATVVRSEPRENLGRAFLGALKGNWKLPKSTPKPEATRKPGPVQNDVATAEEQARGREKIDRVKERWASADPEHQGRWIALIPKEKLAVCLPKSGRSPGFLFFTALAEVIEPDFGGNSPWKTSDLDTPI